MNKKNKIILLFVIMISIIFLIFCYKVITKINYLNHIIISQKERNIRENYKNNLLKKDIILFSKNYNYQKKINLANYKDYFVINWKYCDIDNNFFIWIENDLKEKNIIFKPKINFWNEKKLYKKLWKRLKYSEIKANICKIIRSERSPIGGVSKNFKNIDYINLELENYKYFKKEILDFKKFVLVWKYSISKYKKTPEDSIINSEILIKKISNELIYSWESISVIQKLLNNSAEDLLESNILKNWEIVKWIWWGSCLASTIIYRTLLNGGVEILSQKSHNIYYENIYWINEIWLDSTIYYDDKYKIDLIFKNNYNSAIIFVPKFTKEKIELNIYAKKSEFKTKLIPVKLSDKNKIIWKYEVVNKENNKKTEKYLVSKYDKIDNY